MPYPLLLVGSLACGDAPDEDTASEETNQTQGSSTHFTESETTAQATDTDMTSPGESDPETVSDTHEADSDTHNNDSDTSETDTDTGDPLGCQGRVDNQLVVCEDDYENVDFGWSKVERWNDPRAIPQMDFPPDGRGDVVGQRLVFFDNDPQPASSRFLLYYAPGWDAGGEDPPLVLVHGANDSPDRAWANPNESGAYGCGDTVCPDTGMMQALAKAGHRVFAIGFGHRQGDNRIAAQLLRDAIAVVKERTGSEQVDVVGWSMGAISARMYVSSVGGPYSDPYQGDVRKLILVGGPNAGFDYIFRHGIHHDSLVYPECAGPLMAPVVNAPSPHLASTCFGFQYEHPELSINTVTDGDFYPGQKQMLARWDDIYDIPIINQDWYTTYYGGDGFVSSGLGIDVAMGQGSLIEDILDAGIPASVSTYLLCGDTEGNPSKEIPLLPNEVSGPSDGVVFFDSCADETGIGTVAGSTRITQNHLKLGWHPEAVAAIEAWRTQ
ncbi:MAG: esterase/lipase family protein [Nannocystaceae bacterium]